jgi:hypothetical protein
VYVVISDKMGDGGYKSVDRPYCGTESVRCKTVTFGDTTVNPQKDSVIYVSDGEYKESKIKSYSNKKKTIIGTSSSQTIITSTHSSIGPSSLFFIPSTCPNSTLIISKITFIEKEHVGYSHHIFSVIGSDSTLNLNDIIIKSENINSMMENEIILFSSGGRSSIRLNRIIIKNIFLCCSCFKILDGRAKVCGCEFYNIIVNDGKGGVFYIETKESKSIKFSESCKFENCSVDGNGGGIYCKLNEGGIFIIGDGTSFKNCSSKSSDSEGGKGYVFMNYMLIIYYFYLLLLLFTIIIFIYLFIIIIYYYYFYLFIIIIIYYYYFNI